MSAPLHPDQFAASFETWKRLPSGQRWTRGTSAIVRHADGYRLQIDKGDVTVHSSLEDAQSHYDKQFS